MDPKRHRFQSKFAITLTLVTLLLLTILSALFRTANPWDDEPMSSTRFLEQENDDNNSNNDSDYSRFSCRYIYEKIPEPGYAHCRFAKTCNGGEGVWMSWVFCSKISTFTLFLILSPFLLLWMVTLFRLLGSTAEDYFSPSLEMFSVRLGLPPRFAEQCPPLIRTIDHGGNAAVRCQG